VTETQIHIVLTGMTWLSPNTPMSVSVVSSISTCSSTHTESCRSYQLTSCRHTERERER